MKVKYTTVTEPIGKTNNLSEIFISTKTKPNLGDQDASSSSLLDLFLGGVREVFSFDDDRLLWQNTLSQNLMITAAKNIDNRGLILGFLVFDASLFWNEGPQLVEVNGGLEQGVPSNVEVSHTDLKFTMLSIIDSFINEVI